MSFTINGQVWTPKTASEHAQTELDTINAGRLARGESPLVAATNNAIWLELLAAGQLQQDYDNTLAIASQSFNVATCDDAQVLNLLPVSGTELVPATYSTCAISVTAAAAGNATVPAGTLAPFGSINFVTNTTTFIPAGTTVVIQSTADTPGPYLALPGNITKFSNPITNVQTVTNLANSIPGADAETIAHLRSRLITTRGTITSNLDGTILAVRSLQGIQHANIYFNPDTINNLVLQGGYTIKPRYARIIILGTDVSGELANTYADRMTAPTEGAYSENWMSASGQAIPIFYDVATSQNIYVKVYYDPNQYLASGFDGLIKSTIANLASVVTIGQSITSQLISESLIGFPYATITGVTVSADNITFGRDALVNANSVAQFLVANITVIPGP